jgi:hypothetical protein
MKRNKLQNLILNHLNIKTNKLKKLTKIKEKKEKAIQL